LSYEHIASECPTKKVMILKYNHEISSHHSSSSSSSSEDSSRNKDCE